MQRGSNTAAEGLYGGCLRIHERGALVASLRRMVRMHSKCFNETSEGYSQAWTLLAPAGVESRESAFSAAPQTCKECRALKIQLASCASCLICWAYTYRGGRRK